MSKWELPKEPQFYKWESPITEIFKQVEENYHKQMNDKLEERLMCEVNYQVGYTVDKNELIKALQYDREQYDKGYKDGLRETFIEELEKIKEEIQGLIDFEESCCGNTTLGYECLGVINDKISELKGENE